MKVFQFLLLTEKTPFIAISDGIKDQKNFRKKLHALITTLRSDCSFPVVKAIKKKMSPLYCKILPPQRVMWTDC